MQYTLVMTKTGPRYRVARLFSLLCLLFSLFLLWGLASTLREGVRLASMPHIPVLLLVSLAGALYRDSWSFGVEEETITSLWGFGPCVKRRSYPFDAVQRLELTHFVKGSSSDGTRQLRRRRAAAMVVFSLKLTAGEERTIQIMGERHSAGRLEAAARAIGAATGLSLYIDRPRDMESDLTLHDL